MNTLACLRRILYPLQHNFTNSLKVSLPCDPITLANSGVKTKGALSLLTFNTIVL